MTWCTGLCSPYGGCEGPHYARCVADATQPGALPLPEVLEPWRDALRAGNTPHGVMTWVSEDDPVGVALAKYGEWAQHELHVLCSLLRSDDVVLDVGAYVGTHSRAFAAAVGSQGRVVAVEPQPVIVDLLRWNMEGAPAEVLHAAVGNVPGIVRVPVPAIREHRNFGAAPLLTSEGPEQVEVPIITVDSLGLDRLRLVKIDVEGMEEQVLRGASATLTRSKPVVYAECNSLDAGVRVFDLLVDHDYEVWLHRPAAYNADNLNGDAENLFGPACESNLLAVPASSRQEFDGTLGTRDDLARLHTVDDLAREFLITPRYGDETDRDRDPVALRQRLAEERQGRAAEHEAAAATAAAVREALAGTEADLDRSRRELGRALEEIEAERSRRSRLEQRIELAESEASAAVQEAEEAQNEALHLSARIRAIESSTAWKVAAPVRHLGDARRRFAGSPVGHALRLVVLLLTGRLPAELRYRRTRTRLRQSGLFDDHFYVTAYPDVPPERALDHYLQHGAAEGRLPNSVFDSHWYQQTYPDVAAKGMNPLLHYALAGSAEGRDPSPDFHSSYYLSNNQDVRESGMNPLTHYLRSGIHEGRAPRSSAGPDVAEQEVPLEHPEAPTDEEWSGVQPVQHAPGDPVVVVPVYKGYEGTLRCLYSVLSSPVSGGYRLLVVDDCSPEPELSRALAELAGRGLFELLVNERNQGFVKSVNRAMRAAQGADVVLLNSDTEVFGDWLDRLRASAYARPRIGTVTPLTNSGTIASYPRFVRDNHAQLELSPAELDALASQALRGQTVEIPTCVGFCVYITSACLDEVGLFDEESFGRGYGEENDFSLRALQAGWQHVLTGDVFVRHYGSMSFGDSASALQRAGLAVLRQRYPDYEKIVAEHIRQDPAAVLRRRLDLARLQRARNARPSLLLALHGLGGGTVRHVEDLARELDAGGVFALKLRPHLQSVVLSGTGCGPLPNLAYPWSEQPDDQLVADLHALEVGHLHVHHLQGYDEGAERLPRLADALGLQYDVTLHDFMTVCPRVDMVDHTRRFCGGPAREKCRACVKRNGTPFGRVDIGDWQDQHAGYLRGARAVFVPSRDTAGHVCSAVPGLSVQVRPHPEEEPGEVVPRAARHSAGGKVHVAVLGAISVGKGSDVLLALARDAVERGLPLQYHVFGYTNDDARFTGLGAISMSGRYEAADLPALVEASQATLALFPAVGPETFSYTLSEAVDLGLHPVCFDLGSLPERLHAWGRGTVLPFQLVDDPRQVNDALLHLQVATSPWRRPTARYRDLLSDYYGLELADLQRRS